MLLRSLLVLAPSAFKLRVLKLSIFTLSVLALNACQQAAWKAGASADDLKRDEQACRALTPDAAASKQCLHSKGWTVAEGDPADSNGAAVASIENAAPANTAAAPSATTPSTTAVPAASALATKRAAPDPLQQQSVPAWWKAGAQAADFNADENTCLEQLGAQHAPDYTQHMYTNAMMYCLRARGWFAGRDPVYTPLR